MHDNLVSHSLTDEHLGVSSLGLLGMKLLLISIAKPFGGHRIPFLSSKYLRMEYG